MKRRLITSALPYVNNVPHLGNLIQVLSADVFARFCRLRGYETLYICGTDEYGTATETKAYMENIDPQALCDTYYKLHMDLYKWFQIDFSCFGRTSDPIHSKITQDLFKKIYAADLIYEQEVTQLYSETTERFLADRYIIGTCPQCDYEAARGDQCENCGNLLEPTDLINPRSAVDNSIPVPRKTKHLYLNLPALSEQLHDWVELAGNTERWSRNALQMTRGWLREGLKPRAITRDLRWGIPVPLDGYTSKVFYVWFDAPIGYISITAQHTDDWERWWLDNDDVQLYQFVGKDNIPFHTIIFPAVLIGSKQKWTMLHTISSTEYMNYEGGMFSKSRGVGIFADGARESSIPAAVWRFYLMFNRPERSDYNFSWSNFQQMINMELIGNLSNFMNRVLSFSFRYFDGKLNTVTPEQSIVEEIKKRSSIITDHMEQVELRQALREILKLSDYANRLFQHREPWNVRKHNPEAAQNFISTLIYLVRDIAIFIAPYLPDISDTIASFLGIETLSWDMIGNYSGIECIKQPKILFNFLDDTLISTLQARFSGKQATSEQPSTAVEPEADFNAKVRLCSARIITVEHHPNADKLYVLNLDLGEERRTIVSGLVGHYTPEDLTGKTIILVRNLKPAKLRGIESNGMLLAAHNNDELEVLFLDDVSPGTDLILEGKQLGDEPKRISIDSFHNFSLCLDTEGCLALGTTRLLYKGQTVQAHRLQGCGVE